MKGTPVANLGSLLLFLGPR